jgi:hypothetical protein
MALGATCLHDGQSVPHRRGTDRTDASSLFRGSPLSTDSPRRHVTIEEQGRVLAEAELQNIDPPGTIQAAVHVESGHLPPGTRTRLVDDVLETADVKGAERLKAVVPRGDAEVLVCVRDGLDDVTTRSAGASVVVEGETHREGGTESALPERP